jgi:hypothetical protein
MTMANAHCCNFLQVGHFFLASIGMKAMVGNYFGKAMAARELPSSLGLRQLLC